MSTRITWEKICLGDKLDMQLAPRSDFNEIVVGKFFEAESVKDDAINVIYDARAN